MNFLRIEILSRKFRKCNLLSAYRPLENVHDESISEGILVEEEKEKEQRIHWSTKKRRRKSLIDGETLCSLIGIGPIDLPLGRRIKRNLAGLYNRKAP